MAASDAKALAVKNQALRVSFRIYQSDGTTPQTGAAGLDAALIKDAGASAATTNDPIELSLGWYYLDLTAAEMNADTVLVMPSTTTTGARVPTITLYPEARGYEDLAYPTVSGRSIAVAADGSVTATGGGGGGSVTDVAVLRAMAADARALAAGLLDSEFGAKGWTRDENGIPTGGTFRPDREWVAQAAAAEAFAATLEAVPGVVLP